MSSKQQKFNIRRNLVELKVTAKAKNLTYKMEKQNIIEYLKKQKSKSNQKNYTFTNQNVLKIPLMKRSSNKQNQPDAQDFNTKKLKTQIDVINCKKQQFQMIKRNKEDFNLTMIPKKSEQKSQPKRNLDISNGYFLTADVSNVLRTINDNYKLQNTKLNDKKMNMMTQQDIEKLFQRNQNSNKKKTEERQSDLNRKKNINLIDSIKDIVQKNKLQQTSKSKKKNTIFLTDPDNMQHKLEKLQLNLNKNISQTKHNHNYQKKDFADSIKFLQISQDPRDKLLSALNDQGYIKIQPDASIDKTVKFKQQFVVGKQIGEGAYASVRVAIYKPDNKKVAIKIYEKKKIKQIQRRKSVRRQIKILQQIDHKNILKIYDVIQTNNHVNIIMQFIPGISLNTFLKSQPNSMVQQNDARKIFLPLIQAIKYLHDLSICHRDIKLQNILLDSKLIPKLIDFGFSTCIQNQKKVKMFCGTPSYMAPQIVQKKEYSGIHADIWAMGVLLYVMFTGIFPFKGNTDKQLYQKISNADYPKLNGISKNGENLIQSMLKIDPEDRISASQILKHPWIIGKQIRGDSLKQSKQFRKNGENTQWNQKDELFSRINRQKQQNYKNNFNICNGSRQLKQLNGLAETYKQYNLKYEIRRLKQEEEKSINSSKPRTCTNRDSNKMRFDQQTREIRNESQKIYELLRKELRKKKEKSRQKQKQNSDKKNELIQQKLNNRRYF